MFAEATSASALANSLYRNRENAAPAGGDGSFSQALADAARRLEGDIAAAERQAGDAVRGEGDLQSMVEALSTAELALETAVVMRDRVVQAYQDILRMPV